MNMLHFHSGRKANLKQLFPLPNNIKSFMVELENSDWQIYVEESGNPQGLPVVFLHGGPGATFNISAHQWFHTNNYRVIVFQQRGTHNCIPNAENSSIDANIFSNITLDTIASDMEILRKKLNIEKWVVFGGSWGSTLGLYYAQEFPQSTLGLILRGIFLASEKEMNDFFIHSTHEGNKNYSRKALDTLVDYVVKCGFEGTPSSLCYDYQTLIIKRNDLKACRLWRGYEEYICCLNDENGNEERLDRITSDSHIDCTEDERCASVWQVQLFPWIFENVNLLSDARIEKLKTSSFKVEIVHGANDTLCPVEVARELATKIGSTCHISIIEGGGHGALSHPGMIDALIRATKSSLYQ